MQEKMDETNQAQKAATAQSQAELKALNQRFVDEQHALGTLTEKHAALVTRFDERNTVIETLTIVAAKAGSIHRFP